jgi:GTP-binding protein
LFTFEIGMSLPLVTIVGRPNVGKSSLFNRIVRQRLAVVDDRPGITRDRHLTVADWSGRDFFLMDTGGFLPSSREALDTAVRRQAEIAIEQADVVLLVVDVQTGVTDLDQHLARLLQRRRQPALLVVNKADIADDLRVHEFHRLGLGEPWGVSSTQGLGIGELLDQLVERLPESQAVADPDATRVAIVGRPNVGKSSLVNSLLREERMVVHPRPGTTVDSVDSRLRVKGREYVLVDTAGIRHRAEYEDDAEFYATLRSLRAIERAQVVTLVLEAPVGLIRQDHRIVTAALEAGRPVLLAFNKWDLVEEREARWMALEREIRRVNPWLVDLPRVVLSAVTGVHLHQLPDHWTRLHQEAGRTVPTPELNEWLETVQREKQAPATRLGRPARIYYASQSGKEPPRFVLFASQPEALNASYRKFLLKRLRERFGFTGSPVRLEVRKSQ